ncbi:MAG: hypothetical protein HQL31_01510 [Planctomycetes bacterium]|nr:hypothetical protein [Planctomycetota bacterium]
MPIRALKPGLVNNSGEGPVYLYDGPLDPPRAKRLRDLIASAAACEVRIADGVEALRSESAEPPLCFIHHSALGPERACEVPGRIVFYSGGGLKAPAELPGDLAARVVFLHDSVDAPTESLAELIALLVSAHRSLRGNRRSYHAQLLRMDLAGRVDERLPYVGDFASELMKRYWSCGERPESWQAFRSWARDQILDGERAPGEKLVASCFGRIGGLDAGGWEAFVSGLFKRQAAMLLHDLNPLLFALRKSETGMSVTMGPEILSQWRESWQPRLVALCASAPENLKTEVQVLRGLLAGAGEDGAPEPEGLRGVLGTLRRLSEGSASLPEIRPETRPDLVPEPRPGPPVADLEHAGSGQERVLLCCGSAEGCLMRFLHLQSGSLGPAAAAMRIGSGGSKKIGETLIREVSENAALCSEQLEEARAYASLGELSAELDSRGPLGLYHTLALVDVGGYTEEALNCGTELSASVPLSPFLEERHSRLGIIAKLILAYPHLNLIVLVGSHRQAREAFDNSLGEALPEGSGDREAFLNHAYRSHFFTPEDPGLPKAIYRFLRGTRQLFDPSGLRTLMKIRLVANVFSGVDAQGRPDLSENLDQRRLLARRLDQFSVCIDEDALSSLFHAYGSYRYGFRSCTVTSFAEFDDPSVWNGPARRKIVLRDVDLRFPDIRAGEPSRREDSGGASVRRRLETVYSDLWQKLPGKKKGVKLDDSWRVRVITSSRAKIAGRARLSTEEARVGESFSGQYSDLCPAGVRAKAPAEPRYLGLRKPIPSLESLRELLYSGTWSDPDFLSISSAIAPPPRVKSPLGHRSPYINLPLADQILAQARRCGKDSTEELILGALLAIEADEILMGINEFTGLEALRTLHLAEVHAELSAIGISNRVDISARRRELERVVRVRFEGTPLLEDVFLGRLWEQLRALYRNFEQHQAAEQANVESFAKSKRFSSIVLLSTGEEWLRRGVILLASSPFVWLAVLLAGMSLFFFSYLLVLPDTRTDWGGLLLQVALSSIACEPQMGLGELLSRAGPGAAAVSIGHLSFSYLMFGLFLSMIYRRITRS